MHNACKCMYIHVPLQLNGCYGVVCLNTTDIHCNGFLHVHHGLVDVRAYHELQQPRSRESTCNTCNQMLMFSATSLTSIKYYCIRFVSVVQDCYWTTLYSSQPWLSIKHYIMYTRPHTCTLKNLSWWGQTSMYMYICMYMYVLVHVCAGTHSKPYKS